MTKYVERNVEKKNRKRRVKLPPHVTAKGEGKNEKWYVRKSYNVQQSFIDPETNEQRIKTKQKQIWRICEPKTKARAEQILHEIENELNYVKTGNIKPISNFAEICNEFEKIELIGAVYENGRKIAGRRSLAAPKIALRTINEYFGHRTIGDITFGDLEAFKVARLKTPVQTKYKSRPRTIRTVNFELGVLRQVFNFAYRRRWIKRSPFNDGKGIIQTRDENRRHVNWTRTEETRALEFASSKSLYAHMAAVIICIVDGGFRRGELLGVKWNEVDFIKGTIPAKSYKGKQLNIRTIYLTARMRDTLLIWKEQQKQIKRITDKTLVIGYSEVKKAWNSISKEIGRPDMTLHDLRHVYATRLLRGGVSIKNISTLLGHSSISTTEIYLNLSERDLSSSVNVLNEMNLNEDD